MIKSDGSDTTNGEWLWYIPERKWGVQCYQNNVIQRWLSIWVCTCACTKFCFNAWQAERLLAHQKLIPVRIRGLPVCIQGGRPEILHMGSPRSHNEIVRKLGATHTDHKSGNRKDLKCVARCCHVWSRTIDSHVQYISYSFYIYTIVKLTQYITSFIIM